MKVFIDTNMLLDMYHLSGPDLEELRKFVKLIENGKIDLLLPQQVVDEYWRNRESVIADALKRFRETKAQTTIPNIIRTYAEAVELRESAGKVNSMVGELTARARADIENGALKADEIVGELFSAVQVAAIDDEIVTRARRRIELGNPPGKKGSLGDAINWEWLMSNVPADEASPLCVLSADGDYESELVNGQLREFLLREWHGTHPDCAASLDKSLPEFLEREFPDIKLADEVEKSVAIERLENARGFMSVHRALSRLTTYDDFSEAEVRRLLKAYVGNNQIYWIIHDEDVEAFAYKLLGLAESEEALELTPDLWALLGDEPFWQPLPT